MPPQQDMLGDRFQVNCGPHQAAFVFALSTEEVLLFLSPAQLSVAGSTYTANDAMVSLTGSGE